MTFVPTIPQPGDFQDDSQGQLLTNNAALDASFDVDHTLFSDDTDNNGMHKQVTLYQSAATPTLTAPASMIYSVTTGSVPTASNTNLFYSCMQNNVQKNFQLTGNQSIATNGYTSLPGGLMIQWGQGSATTTGNPISFPTHFPTACFSVTLTAYNTGSSPRAASEVGSATVSGFTAIGPNNPTLVYWMAIGN